MGALYLSVLLTLIGCMLLLDYRFRLFFWYRPAAAALVTCVGVAFLLLWDVLGIGLGVFLRGEGLIATGILIAPEFPIEEPVFLLFMVLCTMVVYRSSVRVLTGRGVGERGVAGFEEEDRGSREPHEGGGE